MKISEFLSLVLSQRFFSWLPASIYLRICFFLKTKKILHLKHPVSFNEKLQWLKLYDHKPEYTTMVDKYAVKQYVAAKIGGGEEYIIPTLGVWEHFDDIDFDKLPDKFVLKCTHDSGGLVICRDKSKFDKEAARKKLEKCLKRNYFLYGREWPYKNVPPRIIAEKYMVDESGVELKDYKIFCFHGVPKIIEVDFNRFVGHKRNLYTTSWELIDLEICYPSDENFKIAKPEHLEKLLQLATVLSQDIPHIRTDFYVINGKIYFGELTFCHGSGFEKFIPEEWDKIFGDWLKLPEKYKNPLKE